MENNSDERQHGTTIELSDLSPLEILEDVQEILTQMVSPGRYAEINQKKWHEQTRTALNLVLRAMSILKKEERRKHAR
jgi:hypothetical protein